jgi:hypothetical protein
LQRVVIVLFAVVTAIPGALACWVMASLINYRESPAVLNDVFRMFDDETRRTIVGAVSAIVAVVPAWMGRLCYRQSATPPEGSRRLSNTGVVVTGVFIVGAILGVSGYVLVDVPKWEQLSTLGPKGLEIIKDGSRHSFSVAMLYLTFFLGARRWPA